MRAVAADTRHVLGTQQPCTVIQGIGFDSHCHTACNYGAVCGAREVKGMSSKRYLWLVCCFATAALVLLPADALAAGNDVGKNVGDLLKHYATEVYGGIVAVISLMFLLNRRYTELAVFLFAAIVVAWMVFAPSEIATAAEAIGQKVFG
jgi:hypothetical protein